MSKKRKRDQNESDAATKEAPAASAPTTAVKPSADTETQASESKRISRSKAQSRQERSERRAKKAAKKQKKADDALPDITEPENKPELEKKEKKAQRKKKRQHTTEDPVQAEEKEDIAPEDSEESTEKPTKKAKRAKKQHQDETKDSGSAARFIVFVGNLPFDATAAQVQQHFSKLAPSSVRLSTDKSTGKGKGFAFIEFDAYDKMKTCLALYHHSIFDPREKHNDGEPKIGRPGDKTQGRRINVELTAGGGGKKSQARQERIKTKNEKMEAERQRRRDKETLEKKAASKKAHAPGTGANAVEGSQEVKDDRGAIHPSRLSRVQH
jgi:nucleolar protein 6